MIISGGRGAQTLTGSAGADVIYGFGPKDASPAAGTITATRIATGLEQPTFAGFAPGDGNALYVTERTTGVIERINLATGSRSKFLDIPDGDFGSAGEGGLLSFAFHPDYATNGRFFVYVTNAAGDIEVREYHHSGGNTRVVDPASKSLVLAIAHPSFTNHYGGQLRSGRTATSIFPLATAAAAMIRQTTPRTPRSLLGKILRIDVDGDDFKADAGRNYAIPDDNPFVGRAGADEIWAYGLRNPWRISFDCRDRRPLDRRRRPGRTRGGRLHGGRQRRRPELRLAHPRRHAP